MRRTSGRKRRPRLQSCVLCCALSATGLLALVHLAALRAMHEKPAVQAPYVLAVGETEVHVVFSTDCSPYQHWQSINVWYSARAVGQRGPVTRIASGCAAAEAGKIAAEWLEIDPTGTFRAHFAPAGALRGGTYKYSNKPSGLYHWLTTARPPPFVDSSRGIVVLIDPDQMLLRPITAALGAGLRPSPRKGELVDADGVPRVLGHNLDGIAERVAPGVAEGQEYGLGGAWGDAGKPTAGKSWRSFDRGRVCGDGPCSRTTVREAAQSYAVGPPYVIHARDAVPLAKAWLRHEPKITRVVNAKESPRFRGAAKHRVGGAGSVAAGAGPSTGGEDTDEIHAQQRGGLVAELLVQGGLDVVRTGRPLGHGHFDAQALPLARIVRLLDRGRTPRGTVRIAKV